MNLNLHIILQKPPANIHFALQKGHGNNFEVVERRLSDGSDLVFDLTIDIKVWEKLIALSSAGLLYKGPTGESLFTLVSEPLPVKLIRPGAGG